MWVLFHQSVFIKVNDYTLRRLSKPQVTPPVLPDRHNRHECTANTSEACRRKEGPEARSVGRAVCSRKEVARRYAHRAAKRLKEARRYTLLHIPTAIASDIADTESDP